MVILEYEGGKAEKAHKVTDWSVDYRLTTFIKSINTLKRLNLPSTIIHHRLPRNFDIGSYAIVSIRMIVCLQIHSTYWFSSLGIYPIRKPGKTDTVLWVKPIPFEFSDYKLFFAKLLVHPLLA